MRAALDKKGGKDHERGRHFLKAKKNRNLMKTKKKVKKRVNNETQSEKQTEEL